MAPFWEAAIEYVPSPQPRSRTRLPYTSPQRPKIAAVSIRSVSAPRYVSLQRAYSDGSIASADSTSMSSFVVLFLISRSPSLLNWITLADPIFRKIIRKHENPQVLETRGTKCFEGRTDVRTLFERTAATIDD